MCGPGTSREGHASPISPAFVAQSEFYSGSPQRSSSAENRIATVNSSSKPPDVTDQSILAPSHGQNTTTTVNNNKHGATTTVATQRRPSTTTAVTRMSSRRKFGRVGTNFPGVTPRQRRASAGQANALGLDAPTRKFPRGFFDNNFTPIMAVSSLSPRHGSAVAVEGGIGLGRAAAAVGVTHRGRAQAACKAPLVPRPSSPRSHAESHPW